MSDSVAQPGDPRHTPRRRRVLVLALVLLCAGSGLCGVRFGVLGVAAQAALFPSSVAIRDQPLRRAYEAEVQGLKRHADEMVQAGLPDEQIARKLHEERRALSIKYQELTPEPLRSTIYKINQGRYGDPHGPSFDYLVRKNTRDGHVDYQALIRGAYHPNRDVDKLLRAPQAAVNEAAPVLAH